MLGKLGNRAIIRTSSGRKLVDHLLLATNSSTKTALRDSNADKGKLVLLVSHNRLGPMSTRGTSLVGLNNVGEERAKGSPRWPSWPPLKI